jgi:hypothetical protein
VCETRPGDGALVQSDARSRTFVVGAGPRVAQLSAGARAAATGRRIVADLAPSFPTRRSPTGPSITGELLTAGCSSVLRLLKPQGTRAASCAGAKLLPVTEWPFEAVREIGLASCRRDLSDALGDCVRVNGCVVRR